MSKEKTKVKNKAKGIVEIQTEVTQTVKGTYDLDKVNKRLDQLTIKEEEAQKRIDDVQLEKNHLTDIKSKIETAIQ